jgi:hypothetical protein
MSAGYALKMIHEDDVYRRAAKRAENRQCAGGRALGDNDAETRGDFRDQAADDRR